MMTQKIKLGVLIIVLSVSLVSLMNACSPKANYQTAPGVDRIRI